MVGSPFVIEPDLAAAPKGGSPVEREGYYPPCTCGCSASASNAPPAGIEPAHTAPRRSQPAAEQWLCSRCNAAPPAGIEPAHTAPEAAALSAELRGRERT